MKHKKIQILAFLFLLVLLPGIETVLMAKSRGGSSGGFQRRSTPSFPSSSGSGSRSYGGGHYSSGGGLGWLALPAIFGGGSGSGSGGGGSFIPVLVIGGIAFMILKSVAAKKRRRQELSGFEETEEGTLIHLQVGLFYGKGELEKELIQISQRVDTGTHSGLVTLLREASMMLRRNEESLRWYHFKKENFESQDALENRFRALVNEERMKLDEEEFTDADGMEINRKKEKDNLEEIIVLSIVAGTAADVMLPEGITVENLDRLVQYLASVPDQQVLGVNVVWNIADRDMLIEKFPEMRGV